MKGRKPHGIFSREKVEPDRPEKSKEERTDD